MLFFKLCLKKNTWERGRETTSAVPQDHHLARVEQATGTVMRAPNRPATRPQSSGAWTLQITQPGEHMGQPLTIACVLADPWVLIHQEAFIEGLLGGRQVLD